MASLLGTLASWCLPVLARTPDVPAVAAAEHPMLLLRPQPRQFRNLPSFAVRPGAAGQQKTGGCHRGIPPVSTERLFARFTFQHSVHPFQRQIPDATPPGSLSGAGNWATFSGIGP